MLLLSKIGGTTVQADGSGSTAQGTSVITTYTFAWGDGTPSTTGGTAIVTHTFVAGTFTVRLTVTDNLGRTGTTTSSITVP